LQPLPKKIGETFNVSRCVIRIYLAQPIPKIPQVAEYLETGQRSTQNLEINVVGNAFAELILSQDKAIAINDISKDSILGNSKYVLERFNIKSMLITRTSYQGKPNGIISLEHCDICRHWTEYEIDLLESVASQVGIAIAQAILLKKEKKQRLKLAKLATIDGLTGVANRRQFDEFLQNEWKRQMREQKPLALILCDVDYFKRYNDTYGHQVGDECLRQIAQVLRSYSRRAADLAARYGGEEFAVILPNIEAENAAKIAEKIRSEVEQLQIPHQASELGYVTLSLGVSCLIPNRETNSQKLVTLADTALYQAKQQGRNQVILQAKQS